MKSSTYRCLNCNKDHNFKGYSYANKYCDNVCQKEYEYTIRIAEWLAGNKTWNLQTPNWVKRFLKESRGDKCEICKISNWNNKPINLECDHIDGNPHNNVESNLRLICPNCHSQTDTYKAKNIGNGRKGRYS